MDPRHGNYSDLMQSTATADWIPEKVERGSLTGDYAYEAWRYGGNVIYFNLEQFQEKIGSYNGTGYDFRRHRAYQYNELEMVIGGITSADSDAAYLSGDGYTATGVQNNWKWAFDYDHDLGLD